MLIHLTRSQRRASVSAVMAGLALALLGASPAHAAWTTIENNGGSVLLACKTPEEGGYGPVWKVTLVLANSQRHDIGSADVEVRRGSSLVGRTTMYNGARGQWDVDTTYASRLFNDRLVGRVGFGDAQGHGSGGWFDVTMDRVTWC